MMATVVAEEDAVVLMMKLAGEHPEHEEAVMGEHPEHCHRYARLSQQGRG